ncbi:laccase domain-containing protein [Adlercreutzia equolifaciens]|uniref:laccase domain-containing protein n=1 Tax=Adlercreutzia equolifaciens TaxID=446660 RepID=UPI00384DE1C5
MSARSATSAAPTSSAVSSSASGPRAPAAPITWIWKLPCAPASPRPVSRRSASRRRGECTACRDDLYFSYRKSGGRCGRHSAFAGRKE